MRGFSMPKTKSFRKIAEQITADSERRARVDEYRRAIDVALRLAELRRQHGITQAELARRLDVSQANISRIEHEEDIYFSTLRQYVEALGGELEVTAVFGDERLRL
jgi:DNA-binding XRE family transcriptional regulator